MARKRDIEETEMIGFEEVQTPALSAFRSAPTDDEVRAHWSSGRARHEAKRLMEQYRTTDAVTGASIYYLPEFDEEGQEKPAPTDLTKVR